MDEKERRDKELTVSRSILYVSRIWLYMSLGALLLYFIVAYAEQRARESGHGERHKYSPFYVVWDQPQKEEKEEEAK